MDSENEKRLKEQLLSIWENNPVFRDNIALLTQVHLRTLHNQIIEESVKRTEDFVRYDLISNAFTNSPLHILNETDTLDLLLENPKSFCRFGDGELLIIRGISTSFQEYDENLARRLSEILQSKSDNCYIGIDPNYFQSTSKFKLLQENRDYAKRNEHWIRSMLLKYCYKKRLYIDARFTSFYMSYIHTRQETQEYFNKFK